MCNCTDTPGKRMISRVKSGTFFLLFFSFWICAFVTSARASSGDGSLEPLNRFPRMVQEYFVRSVRRVESQANSRRAALKTEADAEAYVRDVREKISAEFDNDPQRLVEHYMAEQEKWRDRLLRPVAARRTDVRTGPARQ